MRFPQRPQDRSQVELQVEPASEVWKQERCPKCGGAAKGYDRTEPLRWRHLNVMQYRCELVCRLPRGQCPKCRHTWRLLHKHVDARLCQEADFSNVCCVGVRKGHRHALTEVSMDPGVRPISRGCGGGSRKSGPS
jgi:transposase